MKVLFPALIVLITCVNISHAQDATKGQALYTSCVSCHGEKGEGSASAKAPRLSGQHDWYVLKQLTELKSGVRKIADSERYKALSEQDMKDLAAFIKSL